MAAYRRVYDSSHLQADCQEPGSAPEPYPRQLSMGYLYLFRPMSVGDSTVFRQSINQSVYSPVNTHICTISMNGRSPEKHGVQLAGDTRDSHTVGMTESH